MRAWPAAWRPSRRPCLEVPPALTLARRVASAPAWSAGAGGPPGPSVQGIAALLAVGRSAQAAGEPGGQAAPEAWTTPVADSSPSWPRLPPAFGEDAFAAWRSLATPCRGCCPVRTARGRAGRSAGDHTLASARAMATTAERVAAAPTPAPRRSRRRSGTTGSSRPATWPRRSPRWRPHAPGWRAVSPTPPGRPTSPPPGRRWRRTRDSCGG